MAEIRAVGGPRTREAAPAPEPFGPPSGAPCAAETAPRIEAEAVRLALADHAEGLFRELWGEPAKAAGREWRPRDDAARAMVMRGDRRGLWRDHREGTGGDLLDLIAREVCGLARAGDDFPRALAEAARWCGLAPDAAPDRAALAARRAEREAEAARAAELEDAARAALVAELLARARPVAGTPAARYLARRGVADWPAEAFAYLPPVPDLPVPNAAFGALVAWARDPAGRIVGGQRIALAEDGTRPPVRIAKPAFGRIGGAPCVLPARDAEGAAGPLYVAEGPETAAAIWAATGAEVCAVFGAGQFEAAPLPRGRRVVLCPDRDAPGSPAAAAFGRAVAAHAAAGAELLVAEAPEPEGSRRDFADTLSERGAEAVREALAAASPPPPPEPAPRPVAVETLPPAAEARERIAEAVAQFFAAVARREAVDRFEVSPDRGALHLIEAGLGLGKTRAALAASAERIRALRAAGDAEAAAVVAVPFHRLGEQAAADLRELAPDLRVAVIRGREAPRADDPDATMCGDLNAVREAQSLLLDVEADVCGPCPLRAGCPWQAQKATVADIYLIAHAALAAPPVTAAPSRRQRLDHLIIDEDPRGALLFGVDARPVDLPEAAWSTMRARPWRGRDPAGAEADLRAARAKLARALAKIPPGGAVTRAALLAEGLGEAEAAAAAKLEWRRKVEDADARDELEHNRTIRRAFRVWREVARLLADGAPPASGRLRAVATPEGRALRISGLREVHPAHAAAPALLLDATPEPELLAHHFGGPPDAHARIFAAEPHATVRQDWARSGAKSMLAADLEQRRPSETAAKASRNNRRKLVAFIRRHARRMGGRGLVVANKALTDTLRPHLPPEVDVLHFNGLRGLNAAARVRWAIIVGRTQPAPEDVRRIAEATTGAPLAGAMHPKGAVIRRVTTPGGAGEIEAQAAAHGDPIGAAVLRSIRDAELEQAIGRVRAVNRGAGDPVDVLVLSDAVIRRPVARADAWREILAPTPAERMLDAGGVVFASPAHAARAYPGEWATFNAAKLAFRRQGVKPQWGTSIEVRPLVAATVRAPRGAPAGVWIDAARHPDPRAAVEALLGPLAEFELLAAPAGAEREAAPAEVRALAPPPAPEPPPESRPRRLLVRAPVPGAVMPTPRPGARRWRIGPDGAPVPVAPVVARLAPREGRRLVWAADGFAPPGATREARRRARRLYFPESRPVGELVELEERRPPAPPAPPPSPGAAPAPPLRRLAPEACLIVTPQQQREAHRAIDVHRAKLRRLREAGEAEAAGRRVPAPP